MLATTKCPLACAMVVVARLCSPLNVSRSVGAPPNKMETSASFLPIQRMAVVGFSDTASASSVGPGFVEQFGLRISAAITAIGFVGSGGHDDGRPTSAPRSEEHTSEL